MKTQKISDGVAHAVPTDLQNALRSSESVLTAWESLTPLSRNEWICWVESVKKEETRLHHIKRLITELPQGKRRPCCWMGCTHRTDKPISKTQKYLLEKMAGKKSK